LLHEGTILFAGSRICCGEGRNLKVIIISVGRIYGHIPDISTGMNSRSKDPTRLLCIIYDLRQYEPQVLVGSCVLAQLSIWLLTTYQLVIDFLITS